MHAQIAAATCRLPGQVLYKFAPDIVIHSVTCESPNVFKSNQIKSNLKNFYSAPYNNRRERLTKYVGLIRKCEVKYNIEVSQECGAIGNINPLKPTVAIWVQL